MNVTAFPTTGAPSPGTAVHGTAVPGTAPDRAADSTPGIAQQIANPHAAWTHTASGGLHDFMHPDPDALHWVDIIEPLARLPRFRGHTQGAPLSVAQHCCLMADMVPADQRAHALLFHAHTALTGQIDTQVQDAMLAATARRARHTDRNPFPWIMMQRECLMDLITMTQATIWAFAGIDRPTRETLDIVAAADQYATAREIHWLMPPGRGRQALHAADPELATLPKGKAIRPWNWEAAATMYADALERSLPHFDRGR